MMQPVTTSGAVAAGPTTQSLPPPVLEGRDPEPEERGRAALELIPYDWRTQLPGWQIAFHAAIEGAYGYTLTDERRIDIFVRQDQPDTLLAHVIAHELGHAVDVSHNDDGDRQRWQEFRQVGTVPWWPNSRASDFATGAGDFAECFAAWQVGEAHFRSKLGPLPSPAALALLAELAAG